MRAPIGIVLAVLALCAPADGIRGVDARPRSAPVAVPTSPPAIVERDEVDDEEDAEALLVELETEPEHVDDRAFVRVVAPPIGEVLAAAYVAAGLDRDPTRGLARRARLAGLVPSLSVRTARGVSWRDGEPDVGRGSTLEVRATWRLDRLVFDARELGAASLGMALRRERRRLATLVIRTYFAWRRAASSTRTTRQADEAAAALDAVTEGWFTDAVAHARAAQRPASGQ